MNILKHLRYIVFGLGVLCAIGVVAAILVLVVLILCDPRLQMPFIVTILVNTLLAVAWSIGRSKEDNR